MKLKSNKFLAGFCLCFMLTIFVFCPVTRGSDTTRGKSMKHTVSLDVRDKPLGLVCEKISHATGWNIKTDANCSKFIVTANVREVDIIHALRRLLKECNYALIIDGERKQIKILVCSLKGPREAGLKGSNVKEFSNSTLSDYAREYIKRTRKTNPEPIQADNLNDYAREYIRRTEKNNPEPIQADNPNDYAREYRRRTEKTNPEPIQADNPNDYAREYIRRTEKNNLEPIQADNMNEYLKKYIDRSRSKEGS